MLGGRGGGFVVMVLWILQKRGNAHKNFGRGVVRVEEGVSIARFGGFKGRW